MKTSEALLELDEDVDFSQVEWEAADPAVVVAVVDYGTLDSTKELLAGRPIRVPLGTNTSRLYRFLRKNGFTLRRKTVGDRLYLYTEKRQ